MGEMGEMRKLTKNSTLPVPCSLFPVPCSLFPPLTTRLIQQPLPAYTQFKCMATYCCYNLRKFTEMN